MLFKENKPIYLQIAEFICEEILADKYAELERIPSVREYATNVEVNPNTMVRTFEYLQSNNVIFNKRGMGYFVSEGAKVTIRNMRKQNFLEGTLPEFFREIDLLEITIDDIVKMYNDRRELRT